MSSLTLQMPALPEPVKVVLQPATTALLVFDMIDRICKNQPNCTGSWCRPSPRCWRGHEKPACSSCTPLGAGELEVDAGGRSAPATLSSSRLVRTDFTARNSTKF
jgi:hypothetical protein